MYELVAYDYVTVFYSYRHINNVWKINTDELIDFT